VCDRLLLADGQLSYPASDTPESPWIPELYGDVSLVNGKLFPFLEVEPRPYRLRLLNASNARIYAFALSNGLPFVQIGSDQGLLAAPAEVKRLTLGPAERADLIVDFGAAVGQTLLLQNATQPIMQFRVGAGPRVRGKGAVPSRLRAVARIPESAARKTRSLTLNEYEDPKTHRMIMLLNGSYWSQPVTEDPELDSVEIWSLVNLTEDTHPVHLHLVRFQVLDRQTFDADGFKTNGEMHTLGPRVPPEPNEAGWKDTVRADPGVITRIIARFEGYAGRYVWHCHLLEHAANEMMRPFDVVPRR
jgi:spore coat protein A